MTDISRRRFGQLALGTTALIAFGQPAFADGYANPDLLVEPSALIPFVELTANSRPVYEDNGTVLIDVRVREEFDAGHLPGARHLDPNAVVAEHSPVSGALKPTDEIAMILGELGITPETRVVFYDDKGGFHAARMFWVLEYLGHRNVAVLNGGLSGWVADGGPLTHLTIAHAPAAFQAAPSPRRFASAADVLDQQADPNGVLIDVRPAKMYADGNIPWAINVPWAQNLGEDGKYLPADALQAHFEAAGVTPDRNVIMHCQIGLASSHSYVALRLLGFPRVRVYHRSWAEWGSDPSLPKSS